MNTWGIPGRLASRSSWWRCCRPLRTQCRPNRESRQQDAGGGESRWRSPLLQAGRQQFGSDAVAAFESLRPDFVAVGAKAGIAAALQVLHPVPEVAVCDLARLVDAYDYADGLILAFFGFRDQRREAEFRVVRYYDCESWGGCSLLLGGGFHLRSPYMTIHHSSAPAKQGNNRTAREKAARFQ